ncbi:hypothetical protein [Neobacillus sp. FSL H8-0543]|uniref:hypothetical protein n=1 Tax=Neobacillus sp. FSL H8-0543 TaxID=2954672 RepID=UPI0031593909
MKKFVSVILLIGLLTGCNQSATQDEILEQPKKETKETTLIIDSSKEINGKYQATDKNTGKKIMVDIEDVNTDLIQGDELKVEIKEGKVHKVKTVKEVDTKEVKKVEKPKQQVIEKPRVVPEVTEKPENKPVEQPQPQIEQKPDVVHENPELEEQITEQPAPPIEIPVEPQKPVVPQKTPQELFIEYVDSGNWTLTTNTNYLNEQRLYVYGVQKVEENFVGNYVKKYVEQNISGGKPVTVTVYHVGNGIKTYKFSW